MISEFYHLRRTAMKDLAGYLGFLTGFIGSAPLAWGLLASQLESGTFVRGLWYFFGIVTAAGIFSGIAGLGIGYAGGLVWEQIHRHRRRGRAQAKSVVEPAPADAGTSGPRRIPRFESPPRLQLVGASAPSLPDLSGCSVEAVRFTGGAVELDFGVIRVGLGGSAFISSGTQKSRYPDAGSRDALCALIGARVENVRVISGDRVEISYDNGCEVTVPRSGVAVA